MILSKMGIKMKKEDGEALQKSANEVRQLFVDMGFAPGEEKKSGGDASTASSQMQRPKMGGG